MKHLKTYESVRDFMKPKSKEDILKSIEHMSPNEKLILGFNKNIPWVVELAFEEGANIHYDNETALKQATTEGNLEMVKYLIDKGADLHINEEECLVRACYSGNLELVKYLVEQGADIHAGQLEKVLRAACREGHTEIVKYLLEKGADQRMITSSDVTFGNNRRAVMEILNKYTKNESVKDFLKPKSEEEIEIALGDKTPEELFEIGEWEEQEWLIQFAIDRGLDLDYNNKEPLKTILRQNYVNIVKDLLEKGIDMNPSDGFDPFYIAAMNGHNKIIKLLIKYGVKLNRNPVIVAHNMDQMTSFVLLDDYYRKQKTNESVRDLMKPISKEKIEEFINRYDNLHKALLRTIETHNDYIARIIIKDKGADVHKHNEEALRKAAQLDDDDMVIMLLQSGADPEVAIDYIRNDVEYDYGRSRAIDEIRFFSSYATNESVRDLMKPVSKEDIIKKIKGKPYVLIVNTLKNMDMDIDDLFTKEEQDKMDRYSFSYVDDFEELICVDTKRMKELFVGVGEGVDDIQISSNQYYYNEYQNEYQNELFMTFFDNAWGGISLKEWNRLEEKLQKLKEKNNGINYYEINTSNNSLEIRFDSKYPLEEI